MCRGVWTCAGVPLLMLVYQAPMLFQLYLLIIDSCVMRDSDHYMYHSVCLKDVQGFGNRQPENKDR